MIQALAVMVVGFALWLGLAATGAAHAATCGPEADDKLDKSSLTISGTNVSWAAHSNACSYRVILKSKSPKKRLDAINRYAGTSYPLPTALLDDGEEVQHRDKDAGQQR